MLEPTQSKTDHDPDTDPDTGPEAPDKEHGVLYIGVDLGTSRTAISASNGIRESMQSVVGYPKDVVSRKLLQKDVLYGDEAVAKRLSLSMYRPLEKGVLKHSEADSGKANDNVRAARDLIEAAIGMAKARKDELVYAVIGVPAEASVRNKEAILEAARASVDSAMLCSEPFAVAYGLEMLEDVLVVDIGAGTTDLCRMHGTMPEESDQITSSIAGDAIDAELARLIGESCSGAQFSPQMVKEIKERHAYLGEPSERCMIELPVAGKPTSFDVTEEVRQACSIIIEPIIDGVTQLISSFDPEFQHKLRGRVLLAGGGSMIRGLDSAVEAVMNSSLGGGRAVRIEEPIYGGANGALKVAHDMPEDYWEKLK